ncbi:Uncharacterized conserved protein, DUF58 family, contains vWF domain [Pseudonocardia thermophila]|uniref:Uncharacterized conserved protein, DUF58 family, contains vWF domain n=1 Tax=Pseudonocardia thermophila TaxID=1848 RepID=A0A1M6PAR3_PSETH|nr:DUF58 domain-containing protein [Pseudonocardia thermophila]SHK05026.1 Uncharacterized conserved protein, DUF58 family, contains vWF domain [Pseudonocardia thermophila]
MALTGRLVLAAGVGAVVCGLLPGPATFLAVLAVLLVGVVADVVLAAPVSALRLRRSGDAAVRLGGSATVELVVANPGRRALRALVRDAWPPSAGAAPSRQRITVPPGERRRLTTTLTPTRRGDRRADRVTVRSFGPLGLAARQGSHDVPWTVRALPPFTSRRHLPSRLARLRELDGRTAVMVRGQGTEFDSLREYVIGDDVRSIDWRATARAADVVVRTWRPERDRQVLIVLDTGRTSAGRVGDAPRLDTAMDAALLLGALAARAGDTVGLLAYDRTVRAQAGGAGRGNLLPSLVHAMAPLEPELVETDVRGMVAAVLARATRRSLVVLFTGLDPAIVTEGLLPGLPALLTRHTVIVAAVADPRVDELAADRSDAAAVYAAAAAERARAERRTAAAQLTRRGVTVVDEPPERLAPAVADAYLALKAAGKL